MGRSGSLRGFQGSRGTSLVSSGVKGCVQVSLGFKRSVRGVSGVKGGVPVSQGVMRGVRVVQGVKGRLGDPRVLKGT